ncbi:hypothetical protein AAU57_11960 [Nonlabens sp. YIK11]|uniref:phage tail tape measure protein n=1 Tax=Nonlabens sp. YIK11 TaxID=1453349 RepID=UPI0006DBE7EA|nr:phage tail tape measure protein [Nonlabens sp. YIK11]KQC33963.1 hypothetical protein AAU57_11960 [Nonlabens sp. YIK11]
MSNNSIDTVIDKQAFDQLTRLKEEVRGLTSEFIKMYEASQKLRNKPFLSPSGGAPAARKQLSEMEKMQRALNTTIEKTSLAETELARKYAASREQLRQKNLENKRAAILANEETGAYKRLSTTLNKLRAEYKDVAAAEGIMSKEAIRLRKQVTTLDQSLKKIDASAGQFGRSVANYPTAFRGAASALRNLVGAFGFVGGIYLFSNAVRDSFQRVKQFDNAMQNIAGVMRVTRKDISDLEREIIKVSGASIKTSNEVAKLAENLVTLGKTKEEIKDLLKPVNDLAIGLETTSGEAAEFLVQMLNTFGASTDEAAKYADVIATIRTSTSLDFQRMRDSFQYLAPISRVLNKDLAYTGSLIGILSDNGVKAERAGRLLGTAQQKLAKTGKTLNQALDEINASTARGDTEIQTLKVAYQLMGAQAASLGVVLANNTDIIDTNAEAIRNNSGALKDLTDQQLESLENKLKILDATWEALILNIDNGTGPVSDFFKTAIEGATRLLKMFDKLNETRDDRLLNSNQRGRQSAEDEFTNQQTKTEYTDEDLKNQKVFDSRLNKRVTDEEFAKQQRDKRKRELDQFLVDSSKGVTVINQELAKLDEEFSKNTWYSTKMTDRTYEKRKKQLEAEKYLIESQAASLRGQVEFYDEILNKTDEVNTDLDTGDGDTGGGSGGGSTNNLAAKRMKDSMALKEFLLEQEIELNDAIFQDEELTYISRLASLERFEEAKIELAQLRLDEELKANKDSLDGQRLARLKYEQELVEIDRERLERLKTMVVDVNDVMEEQGLEEIIDNVPVEDALQSLANTFKTSFEEMQEAYQRFLDGGGQGGFGAFAQTMADQFKAANEQIADLSEQIGRELINTTNAIFDNRQQRIEDDIQRNNDYYARLLDNERLSTEQRDQLEAEREAKNRQLEKKKRGEQRKQAIFNKTVALAEIAINTALAVSKVTAQAGLAAPLLIPAIIALGAAQAATVLATPIPRYKTGKKKSDNYEGIALLNDGGRDEVRVSADGSVERLKGRNIIGHVAKDDVIYPSEQAFNDALRQGDMDYLKSTLNQNGIMLSGASKSNKISTAGIRNEIKQGIKSGFKSVRLNPTINVQNGSIDDYIKRKTGWIRKG